MAKKKRKQKPRLPKEFLDRLKAITAKRAKTVIDHILKHGSITTEELSDKYGYDHPPRAARDVREQGIPLVTYRVTGSHGRKIGAYKFGDPAKGKAENSAVARRGPRISRTPWQSFTGCVAAYVSPNTNRVTSRSIIGFRMKSVVIPLAS